MTVKELREELANYSDDMEVMAEHTKSCLGTFSVCCVSERLPNDLEDNWRETTEPVCLIGIR